MPSTRACRNRPLRIVVALALSGFVAVAGALPSTPGEADTARRPTAAAGSGPSSKPGGAVIRIASGAAFQGYQTRAVTMHRGGALSVRNADSMAHTVTSVGRKANGKPLFDTVVAPGDTVAVKGAVSLAPGTYRFYCRYHAAMRGTLTVTGSGGGHHAARSRFQQPLAVPRVITSVHPHLIVSRQPVRVLPHGPKTMMWTYGGSYPAPTIRRPAGRDTKVTFTDRLPAEAGSISVHLHGDHHSSADDGQPTTHLIDPGGSKTYDYPLMDAGHRTRSTLDYYHDHRMGSTGRNNWFGMQGMFEITSPSQTRLGLPSGRYDIPLMVADRTFDAHNQLTDPFRDDAPPPDDGITGQQVLVDGRVAPYLDVSTHKYRFRLLNSSNFTSYDFALSGGRSFLQIGNGDGLFAHPVRRDHILLGPAQTADVVVDFGHQVGRRIVLRSAPRTTNPHHGTASADAPLMQFRVTRSTHDTSRVPRKLETAPRFHAPRQVSFHWVLGRTGSATSSQWTINDAPFDPDQVDVTVPLGATRTWEISNPTTTTHYVHLHEEEWHTISRDGRRPPPWERGLEDTWRLDPGESITVAAHFTDYPGVFMIHCHMLEHEDHGMMAQYAVLAPGQTAPPAGYYLPQDAPAHADSSTMSMPMPSDATPADPG